MSFNRQCYMFCILCAKNIHQIKTAMTSRVKELTEQQHLIVYYLLNFSRANRSTENLFFFDLKDFISKIKLSIVKILGSPFTCDRLFFHSFIKNTALVKSIKHLNLMFYILYLIKYEK